MKISLTDAPTKQWVIDGDTIEQKECCEEWNPFTQNAVLSPILLEKVDRKMIEVTLNLKVPTLVEYLPGTVFSGLLNAP